MDLRLYSRVLRRFWHILLLGVGLAPGLALLSYYNVTFNGAKPELTPRGVEVWQSGATLFLTEPGFPAGRTRIDVVPVKIGTEVVLQSEQNSPGTYALLTGLYAKLAQGDRVAELIRRDGQGPVTGTFIAIPTADTSTSRAEPLPMLSLFGSASTPREAESTVERGKKAFLRYLRSEQAKAAIPVDKRVIVQTVNEPQPAQLLVPRKKTLPFVVFLAVLFATIALLFVLENLRPSRAHASEHALVEVRRSA
jgi:hypothetical protein